MDTPVRAAVGAAVVRHKVPNVAAESINISVSAGLINIIIIRVNNRIYQGILDARPCLVKSIFLSNGATLDNISYPFQPPLDLAQFIAEQDDLDWDAGTGDVFLYHGTNCYRRWEIKRCGMIEPGRSHYSFFCTKAGTALTYARAACMRDMTNHNINSLICEPVVLKVRFNKRNWLQVDFWQPVNPGNTDEKGNLSLAVLGPISTDFIVSILYCGHGRKLHSGFGSLKTRTLVAELQQLREKLIKRRADAWVLKQLGGFSQTVSSKLSGGIVPDLTLVDSVKRLRQVSCRSI